MWVLDVVLNVGQIGRPYHDHEVDRDQQTAVQCTRWFIRPQLSAAFARVRCGRLISIGGKYRCSRPSSSQCRSSSRGDAECTSVRVAATDGMSQTDRRCRGEAAHLPTNGVGTTRPGQPRASDVDLDVVADHDLWLDERQRDAVSEHRREVARRHLADRRRRRRSRRSRIVAAACLRWRCRRGNASTPRSRSSINACLPRNSGLSNATTHARPAWSDVIPGPSS